MTTFPIDDLTLAALDHALDARLTYDDNGDPRRVGAEFSVPQLLNFLSGYDPANLVGDERIAEYVGPPVFTRDDVIRSLIAEVRRLRGNQ